VTAPAHEGGSAGGPTVLRIMLGAQLRRLREAKGISRDAAGYEIRASESKISRMELGRVGFKERDIADLLTLYGVDDEHERSVLFNLAREANTAGWWQKYSDVLPGWFQPYVGLEAAAALIRTYEVQFVPGLLQCPEYARAIIALGHQGASGEEIERRVKLRLVRQQVLTRAEPVTLWAVIDEGALRRPIGGDEVMRTQIEYLIESTKLPNVRLQIVPFRAGVHSAMGGSFTILRFPDPELPDLIYVEQLTGALFLDRREDVDHYAAANDLLCLGADPATRTPEILKSILKEF
jgi:transcriptional regulator with XRE-family HTH domain